MKKRVSNIALAAVIVSMTTTSVSAFDLKLIYSMPPETHWTNDSDNTYTSYGYSTINGVTTDLTKTVTTHTDVDQYTLDSNMIGFEYGHYVNSNHEGFGFGWHLGFAYPIGEKFSKAGTIDLGIAPGYSITRNLAVKIELGLGVKRGFSVENNNRVENTIFVSGVYGLSAEYVFVDHLVLGAAVKFREYLESDTYGIAKATPEISVAYRF